MDACKWREGWQEFAGDIEVGKVEETSEQLRKDLKILSKVK